jgi:hypothetical protein
MTVPICSVNNYLEEKHPKFHKLIKGLCINIDSVMCVLIPSDAKCAAISKELKGKSPISDEYKQAYFKAKGKVLAHLLNQTVNADFKGGLTTNRAKKKVSISPVSGGKFTVTYDTDTGKTVDVKCELIKDAIPAPTMSGGDRGFSFAKIINGDPIAEGKTIERGEKLEGSFRGGRMEAEQPSSKTSTIKLALAKQCVEYTKASGKDYYTPVVCGMLKCLDMHSDKYSAECKELCNYIYPCAASTFYTVLQPYRSSGQILPNEFIEHWYGAPAYGDYNSIVKDFCSKHCDSGTKEKLSGLKAKLENTMADKNLALQLKKIYSDIFSGIFKHGTPEMKVWADELAFKV